VQTRVYHGDRECKTASVRRLVKTHNRTLVAKLEEMARDQENELSGLSSGAEESVTANVTSGGSKESSL